MPNLKCTQKVFLRLILSSTTLLIGRANCAFIERLKRYKTQLCFIKTIIINVMKYQVSTMGYTFLNLNLTVNPETVVYWTTHFLCYVLNKDLHVMALFGLYFFDAIKCIALFLKIYLLM